MGSSPSLQIRDRLDRAFYVRSHANDVSPVLLCSSPTPLLARFDHVIE